MSQQLLLKLQEIDCRLSDIQLALQQHGIEARYDKDDTGLPGISGNTINDVIQIKK